MISSKTRIARTGKTGKGLFATRDIRKGERLFCVTGKVRREAYAPGYNHIGPRWLAIGVEKWLIPVRTCPWWYLNHSCRPNVGLKGKVTVVAMRRIRKGEELTLDYAVTEHDPYWSMRCLCDEKSCRKVVRSILFLPRRLAKKYEKYTPSWLKKYGGARS